MALPWLLLLACRPAPPPPPTPTVQSPAERPDIVLIVWESTRADHVPLRGEPGNPTTPGLAALAQRSVVFRAEQSVAPWTHPSVASLLTGLAPTAHGVRSYSDELSPDVPTLAERLHEGGYETAFIGSNAWFEASHGLARGFDWYHGVDATPGELLAQDLLTWLDQRASEPPASPASPAPAGGRRPTFLYLHLFDPHCPYTPPDQYEHLFTPVPSARHTDRRLRLEAWQQLNGCYQLPAQGEPGEPVLDMDTVMAAYDAELLHADQVTTVLLQRLRDCGLLDRSLLIFTADHGEAFLDHGIQGHGPDLYAEAVHVPLLVQPPWTGAGPAPWAGLSVDQDTSSLDIPATILAAAGLPPLAQGEGQDLSPLWRGTADPAAPPRAVFSETDDHASKRSVRRGQWELIMDLDQHSLALYDRDADPGETTDLSTLQPELRAELARLLAEHDRKLRAQALTRTHRDGPMDAATRKALQRLGYVE